MQYNLLLTLVAGPIIAGLAVLFMPDRARRLTEIFSFGVAAACLAGSILVFMRKGIVYMAGPSVILSADTLGASIGMAAALFSLLIALYSSAFIERGFGRYFACMLITLGSSFGAVYANNLIALIVFWGMLAVTLYLLVGMRNTEGSARAAKKALLVVGGTDALMIFGIALLWVQSGTFSMDKIHLKIAGGYELAAYLCIATAAFAKAGVVPFHSWLPDVAEEASTPVAAYLPASLDKLLGIYLLARSSFGLFVMSSFTNSLLAVAGALTIVFAVLVALVQHDLKRLLGYHAVSQVGYMVLGIATANPLGVAGGLFHMINNAIYKSCLFLGGGAVEKSSGTTELSKLGGLAKFMPATFLSFLIASLSISGIPPFNGFVSKWMIYQGIIEAMQKRPILWTFCLVCAMFGSSLTIASFMKLLHAVFLGRREKGSRSVKEAAWQMSVPMALLAVLCVVFGVFAFSIPLPLFVLPSLKILAVYLGAWHPLLATGLIFTGIMAGLALYLISRARNFRRSGTFIGGEEVSAFTKVSGTEFYDTIKDLKILGMLYSGEEKGAFDLYNVCGRAMRACAMPLQRLHNGVLPTYLVWCLLGMVGLFLFIFFG